MQALFNCFYMNTIRENHGKFYYLKEHLLKYEVIIGEFMLKKLWKNESKHTKTEKPRHNTIQVCLFYFYFLLKQIISCSC